MATFNIGRAVKRAIRNAPIKRFFNSLVSPILSRSEQRLLDRFHDFYYRRWQNGGGTITSYWFGHRAEKCPLDLWVYQEILFELKPDVIIETGTRFGGSAMFLASMCDLIGKGKVISVDIDPDALRPVHPRVTYVQGSSTANETLERVNGLCGNAENCLVILDSDHARDHVRREIEAYRGFVPVGGYMIVEDSNVNGFPTYPNHGPGPMESIYDYLQDHDDFIVDRTRERFLLTLNPCGYLKRVR